MISTRIRQTKHIAFGLGLLLCTSLASAAQISADSTIAFVGTSTTSGALPNVGPGSLSITGASAVYLSGDFLTLADPSGTTFANPISWQADGAISAPASGEQLWYIGGSAASPLASFILGEGTASATPASKVEIVATGILTLIGYDNTPGTFVFNETSYTFSATSVAEVPLPAAVWLFGSALMGLVAVRRRPEAK